MSNLFTQLSHENSKFVAQTNQKTALDATRKLISSLKQANPADVASITAQVAAWKELLSATQKSCNNGVLKFLKFIDQKLYEFELADEVGRVGVTPIKMTNENKNLVNEAILAHITRDMARKWGNKLSEDDDRLLESLEAQWGVSMSEEMKGCLRQLQKILHSLANYYLAPAFEWCEKHVTVLKERRSDLEFDLHVLQFYVLLGSSNSGASSPTGSSASSVSSASSSAEFPTKIPPENVSRFTAFLYAKQNFSRFLYVPDNGKKFSTASSLMSQTVLNSAGDTEKIHNKITELSGRIIDQFTQLFCEIHGVPTRSNLYRVLISAVIGLPSLIKFNSVNKKLQRSLSEISPEPFEDNNMNTNKTATDKYELPIEIEVEEPFKSRHPIFICPISREETTTSNPPILLPCNHIISEESMNKLVESRSGFGRIRRQNAVFADSEGEDDEEEEEEEEDEGDRDHDDNDGNISVEDPDYLVSDDENGDDGDEILPGNWMSTNREEGVELRESFATFRRAETGDWRISGISSRNLENVSFKCPYCPSMCRKSQTRRVFFGE